jgi:hypothetical protein
MSKSRTDCPDETLVVSEITDEALERAGCPCDAAVPTLVGTYCFTCPVGIGLDVTLLGALPFSPPGLPGVLRHATV